MNKPTGSGAGDPDLGEFGLIAWIRGRALSNPLIRTGIGDDCAVIRTRPGSDLLATTDMLVEGRHFSFETATPRQVGYKAMGVNLSDIAAMAGKPTAALVAVALPRERSVGVAMARDLIEGMSELAGRFDVVLAGGDTNAWAGPLVISVTMLGETVPPGPVQRSGAHPGDLVFVTGPLGGSLLGRHLNPCPRVHEALALAQAISIHAMIDISDGLVSDLMHILEESGVSGAILDAESIPIHPDAVRASLQDGRTPLEHALCDGEDFELCFTVDPSAAGRLSEQPVAGLTLIQIGVLTHDSGLWIKRPNSVIEPILARGFDHFRD